MKRSGNCAGLDKLDGLKPSSFGIVLLLSFASSASAVPTLDQAAVKAAAEYSARHRGVSFLAIQNGRTLLEQDAKTPHKIYSGTKAFWDLAALAAAEDGLFDLDNHVADTITSWRNDPRKSQVTIRQTRLPNIPKAKCYTVPEAVATGQTTRIFSRKAA